MGAAYDRLAVVLAQHGCRRNGNGLWQCPAHEDNSPSLSVTAKRDRVLVHCFGGCDIRDVLAALGLGMSDLYDEPRANATQLSGARTVAKPKTRDASIWPTLQVYLVDEDADYFIDCPHCSGTHVTSGPGHHFADCRLGGYRIIIEQVPPLTPDERIAYAEQLVAEMADEQYRRMTGGTT